MNKKNLFLWSLYDFANSFVFINFLLYFSQWLVIDGGLSDFRYNATFAIATVVLLFSAPKLASYTDKRGHRKLFLILSTIGTAISYGIAVWFAYLGLGIPLIALFFILGQYFYQLSFVFYNPLIKDIADEKHYARAFGIGQFSNSIGQVAGLLATLSLVGISRLAPLIPSIVIFVILALPMLIRFKESKKVEKIPINAIASGGFVPISKKKLILFFTASTAAPMIIAFFFFNDASLTVSNNFGIFLEKVFAVADSTKSILLMLLIVMAAIGGIVSGRIGDRIGQLKTLKGIFIGWIICLLLLSVTKSFIIFSVITIITGSLIGAGRAVSRAYLTSVLKKEELGYGFAFYSLSERFATFLGPLTRGAIVGYFGQSALGYRYAMAFMIIFMVIGLGILVIKRPKRTLVNKVE